MPLDPIISLAVALAESPGACACLLGSGVSVDAGVPTGWAVYRDGLRRLYRLENETAESPPDHELDAWLEETDRADLGYSSLLDLIAPDPAIRRALLAGYFEGAEPGATHNTLADMAVRGVLRVFVTTNFDRLLERALLARGVEPVVVSDDATLAAAPRREHAPVFIVKAHGDYLQETIRNTPSELASLEPALTSELRSIADHYGLLVLGWSGSDPALAEVLRARTSRYGTWWLSLADPPGEPGRTLAEAVGARVIVRSGAAAMLSELDRRLAVYESHDTGDDPGSVHDETLALVRRDDAVGLDELLRSEGFEFESAVEAVTSDHINDHLDQATVRDAWGRLAAASDRRLASLIPLSLHRPELIETALRTHASWATGSQPRGGGMTWQEAWVFPFWTIGMTLGSLLLRLDRYDAIQHILSATWTNHYGTREPFIGHPGEVGNAVAEVFGAAPPEGQHWLFPAWTWLGADIPARQWLADRYPEWLRREGEPQSTLAAFDMLVCIAGGIRDGGRQLALWSLQSEAAGRFARRLHDDPRLRAQAAMAVGTTLEAFDQQAPEILSAAQGVGHFPRVAETANILRTGTFRG